ncbi:MAG TPA: ATP-binding protein [Acidimicrobiia bacterium]|jgi:signal transduction histidine kinase
MSDRTRIVIGRIMAAVAVIGAIAGSLWLAVERPDVLMGDWVLHNALVAVGFGAIAWLVVTRQPRNHVVWVSTWAAFFTGVYCLLEAVLYHQLSGLGFESAFYDLRPADLPTAVALTAQQVTWLYIPGLYLVLSLGFMLFPDGSPPTPRWLPAAWAAVVAVAMTAAGHFWVFRPSGTLAYSTATDTSGPYRDMGLLVALGNIVILGLIVASLVAMVLRFRRSGGVERQQFRWIVWGSAVAVIVLMPVVVVDIANRSNVARYPLLLCLSILIASYGVAISRYRLYDVDLVISRTFVYGSLGLFIAGVYVAVVVGIGSLFGGDEPSTALSLVATVVVALAFQPLRRRLQSVANRIVYGRRATPYEVLSAFSQRVSVVDESVLGQITRSLVEGTTAGSAALWIVNGAELHLLAAWPEAGVAVDRAPIYGPLPDADLEAVVTHDGERLGMVTLAARHGQAFLPTDERLVAQVASGLGLALRNLQLTTDLQQRVDQLRQSRTRIVAVQDETRRKLERDLHDGAQQRLVALKIKLGIGGVMARRNAAGDVYELLERLRGESDQVIDSIRDFARGIYPPLMEAEGLAAAITGHARKLPLPVTVHAAGLDRYPPAVESTVYFCVLEALQNMVTHAGAASGHISLVDDGELQFEVTDDGAGFDPEATAQRGGLVNMNDRIDAAGGSLTIRSAPGRGTIISGRIPSDVTASV